MVWAALVVAVALVLGSHVVSAADEPKPVDTTSQPKATDLIFERKHLDEGRGRQGDQLQVQPDSRATEKVLGIGFSDTITLKVTADKDDGKKDLDLQIYTGDRARDLQKLEKFSINPVFAVFFAQAVNTFHQLAGGQVNYLQTSLFRRLDEGQGRADQGRLQGQEDRRLPHLHDAVRRRQIRSRRCRAGRAPSTTSS